MSFVMKIAKKGESVNTAKDLVLDSEQPNIKDYIVGEYTYTLSNNDPTPLVIPVKEHNLKIIPAAFVFIYDDNKTYSYGGVADSPGWYISTYYRAEGSEVDDTNWSYWYWGYYTDEKKLYLTFTKEFMGTASANLKGRSYKFKYYILAERGDYKDTEPEVTISNSEYSI